MPKGLKAYLGAAVEESDSEHHVSAIPAWEQDAWSESARGFEAPAPGWGDDEEDASDDVGDADDAEQVEEEGADEDHEDGSSSGGGAAFGQSSRASKASQLSRTVVAQGAELKEVKGALARMEQMLGNLTLTQRQPSGRRQQQQRQQFDDSEDFEEPQLFSQQLRPSRSFVARGAEESPRSSHLVCFPGVADAVG